MPKRWNKSRCALKSLSFLISNADHIWRLTIENSYTNTILMNPSVLIFAQPRSAQQLPFSFRAHNDIINMLIHNAPIYVHANVLPNWILSLSIYASQCCCSANCKPRKWERARTPRHRSTNQRNNEFNLIYLHLIQYNN